MSLFRKPKKHIQRRVFSANEEDDGVEKIDMDDDKPIIQPKIKKTEKKEKTQTKQTLLSFGDEGLIFFI